MTVFVFGNPDLPTDTLPLRLLAALRQRFPRVTFEAKDPNEEWDVPPHLIVIDTVMGADRVQRFDGLEAFTRTPRVTLHDFDALTNLQLLRKLGKLQAVTVIGVPPALPEAEALVAVAGLLTPLVSEGTPL